MSGAVFAKNESGFGFDLNGIFWVKNGVLNTRSLQSEI